MEELFRLLKKGVTASHVVDYVKKDLLKNQFQELNLEDEWELKKNSGYYVNLYGSGCVAFRTGEHIDDFPAFRIAMAHSDFPCFQIKPNPMVKGRYCARLNVEIYGGMYQKSWIDRPLGVAGRVVIKGKTVFTPQVLLYKSDRPLCIIPSLAIHMDKELNKKGALETAKELVPLAALSEEEDLLSNVADSLNIQTSDILDYDLYLYNMDVPVVAGLDSSMLAAPRLDNLTSVGSILHGIKNCGKIPDHTIDMMVVFDNEEVGSLTKQGADSELLPLVIDKIGKGLRGNGFEKSKILEKSFLLSVDVAHANHPNYEEKSDANNRAYLGHGISIKRSVGQKYGTTAESAAVIKQLCSKENIPFSIAINKTGIPGGSTLGPIVTSHLPFPCADVGMPILAMHSAVELGAVADYEALKIFIKTFYETV
ncbi:MAG: M18 family aminopeptidase [Lachnospiraceae bacterium]|nr:M18 family aminopeptidase [Lachnospiraceae bacterium]